MRNILYALACILYAIACIVSLQGCSSIPHHGEVGAAISPAGYETLCKNQLAAVTNTVGRGASEQVIVREGDVHIQLKETGWLLLFLIIWNSLLTSLVVELWRRRSRA